MQTIKLKNGLEFGVKSIVSFSNVLEITFTEGILYTDIAKTYDPISTSFSEDVLRRMEVYSEDDVLQGTHLGYTKTQDISAINDIVKVKIMKEDEIRTEVELLKEQNEMLNNAVSELTMIVAMGGM